MVCRKKEKASRGGCTLATVSTWFLSDNSPDKKSDGVENLGLLPTYYIKSLSIAASVFFSAECSALCFFFFFGLPLLLGFSFGFAIGFSGLTFRARASGLGFSFGFAIGFSGLTFRARASGFRV